MARGRQTRTLSREQRERLEEFRRSPHEGARHGYSFPQLRSALGAQFGWRTLQKALQGLPVWDLSYAYIVQWMERFLPPRPLPLDGKAAAAGERPEDDDEEESEATRTIRGSR